MTMTMMMTMTMTIIGDYCQNDNCKDSLLKQRENVKILYLRYFDWQIPVFITEVD